MGNKRKKTVTKCMISIRLFHYYEMALSHSTHNSSQGRTTTTDHVTVQPSLRTDWRTERQSDIKKRSRTNSKKMHSSDYPHTTTPSLFDFWSLHTPQYWGRWLCFYRREKWEEIMQFLQIYGIQSEFWNGSINPGKLLHALGIFFFSSVCVYGIDSRRGTNWER